MRTFINYLILIAWFIMTFFEIATSLVIEKFRKKRKL
jgi:hypothetical protein